MHKIVIKMRLILTLISIASLSHSKCPTQDLIDPCYCDSDNFYCGGTQYVNFKKLFERVSKALDTPEDKHFNLLYFNNTAVTEFENDLFMDLTFKNIHVHNATNLKKIYAHAFTGNIVNVLEIFQQDGDSLLGDDGDTAVKELFDAFSALLNVRMIKLERTKIRAIPDSAFHIINGAQTQFTHFELNNGIVAAIGDHAFYELRNMQNIYLLNQQINHIKLHSFDFRYSINKTLSVHLSGNNLESAGIEINAFTDTKRPLHLYLNNNPITHLVSDVFKPIFSADNHTIVDIGGIPLRCNCDTAWLVRARDMYASRVINGQCKGQPNDTVLLWDLKLRDIIDCPDTLFMKF